MVGLLFLILFFSSIAGIYYHTRYISSIKKRIALAMGIPLLFCYMLFFKSWTAKIFTPLYCLVHSNTKIKEHFHPDQWKKERSKTTDINLYALGEFDFLGSNFDKSKYIKDINIDGTDYKLVYFNQRMPNIVIYISDNSRLFGKNVYLYYDINMDKPIISIDDYVSEYRGVSGSNNVWHCNDNALLDLRNYFMENYLNKQ